MNMDPEPVQQIPLSASRIAARSKRQAIDWSLVLASQGIEHAIEYADDTGWVLVVTTRDYERAISTLRLYRLENSSWPWRKEVFHTQIVFDWGSLAWVLLIAAFFWLSEVRIDLRSVGMMDSTAVTGGQWWRLFTAMFLHADLGHLATNASIGFALLGLAMGRYGTGVGLLAAYLAGAAGNVASWLGYMELHRNLGASGMVMGALGLLAAQSLSLRRQLQDVTKHIAGGVVGGVMLFVLIGLTPGTDVVAHFGGFTAGLLFGAVLTLKTNLARKWFANLSAGLLFATFVIWTWTLALRATG
jgi:membrane associated rhomboid family serine protease